MNQESLFKDEEYRIKLKIFEGPMDLLLHLIRKNEVDIFDIPIAEITDQYLAYIDMMKALNINIAGDFLVMASTLVHIKSRMLLPSYSEGEEGEEDPRVEITRPLIEYLRFKEMAGELSEREMLGRDVFHREVSSQFLAEIKDEGQSLNVNLFQLMDAFKRIVEEQLPGASLEIQVDEWSLKERMTFIMDRVKEPKTLYFRELFKKSKNISEFIITFLALLELVHLGLIKVYQPDQDKDIRLEANFDENEEKTYHEIIEADH
jgi:segregation and condensation protein A